MGVEQDPGRDLIGFRRVVAVVVRSGLGVRAVPVIRSVKQGFFVLVGFCMVGVGGAAEAVDPELPPSAVDRFEYPGADQLFAETGVRLLTGDGHVLMTPCTDDTSDLVVVQRTGAADVCFRATGVTGAELFVLYDTYGFPFELSTEEARRNGIAVSETWREEFDMHMEAQRARSRA